ncbi:MAG: exodeoxyribonuclease VII large subunit [Deltaproteobacteria bacterium]|nr:exodeoxyribonuclease VII large subunit [Deltaproteobacteria bacterium]
MVVARPRRAPAPLSVSQLTALVRGALDREIGSVLVAGEISNLRPAASGHVYFTLKDDRSQLRCVMFRSVAQLLVFRPEHGQEVILRGRVDLYSERGELQLYVDRMEPQGRGALQLAFEQMKARLAAEGLFDEDRKRALPFFPSRIGIATALNGAALHDILVILRARCPVVPVVVRPVRVQGPGSADDICQAIADLNRDPALDVLIVGRGGGSLEDLWSFNEESVARAIAASGVPVVSAVGHEIDFTIADFVADRRAPTPTAAAEMVVPRLADLRALVARGQAGLAGALGRRSEREQRHLAQLAGRLRDPRRRIRDLRAATDAGAARLDAAMRRRLTAARAQADTGAHRLAMQHPGARIAALARAVALLRHRLGLDGRRALAAARERVGRAAAALDGLSPLAVLARGYSLVRRVEDGAIVRAGAALAAGDEIDIRFAVGSARARVLAPAGRRAAKRTTGGSP